MNRIANAIADWIAQNNGLEDEREVYAYGIECLMNTILTFGSILIVTAIMGRVDIAIVWLLFFTPLRHASGGLHAPNHMGCFIVSLSVGIGCALINPLIAGMDLIVILGAAFSIAVVFAVAPVVHTNHPISEQLYGRTKIMARRIVLVETICLIALVLSAQSKYATAGVLGVLSASVSAFIGHFYRQ